MAGYMKGGIPGPDSRDREQLELEIGQLSVSYTPRWRFNREQPDMGTALARLFAGMMEESIGKYNRLLEINRREFMESVGAKPLPAGLAEGYMTFGLVKPDMPECLIPSGTGVSAVTPGGSVRFETVEEVWVSAAKVDFTVVSGGGKDEAEPGLYLCFDRDLSQNVISLLILPGRRETAYIGRVRWEYGGSDGWLPLEAEDGTEGLSHGGIFRFAGPPDLAKRQRLGRQGYWLRAVAADVRRMAVSADVRRTAADTDARRVAAGADDMRRAAAGADMRHVVAGADMRRAAVGADMRRVVAGADMGRAVAGADMRRAAAGADMRRAAAGAYIPRTFIGVEAVCINGAGVRAVKPGPEGNLAPGGKHRLAKTVGFVSTVRNPDCFYGGSGEEDEMAFMDRIGAGLRHRGRAVTPGDFECLVRAACRDAYRVKCFPGYEGTGKKRYGAVTVVILQRDFQEGRRYFYKVRETAEACLRDKVSRELLEGNLLTITSPRLIRVDVRARICVEGVRQVMEIRKQAREMLEGFLNPINGGSDGSGWDLGRLPEYRQLKNCLQNVPGTMYVKQLSCLCYEECAGQWQEVEQEQIRGFPWVLPMAGECIIEAAAGGV